MLELIIFVNIITFFQVNSNYIGENKKRPRLSRLFHKFESGNLLSVYFHFFKKHFFRPNPKLVGILNRAINHQIFQCFAVFGRADDFVDIAFEMFVFA